MSHKLTRLGSQTSSVGSRRSIRSELLNRLFDIGFDFLDFRFFGGVHGFYDLAEGGAFIGADRQSAWFTGR